MKEEKFRFRSFIFVGIFLGKENFLVSWICPSVKYHNQSNTYSLSSFLSYLYNTTFYFIASFLGENERERERKRRIGQEKDKREEGRTRILNKQPSEQIKYDDQYSLLGFIPSYSFLHILYLSLSLSLQFSLTLFTVLSSHIFSALLHRTHSSPSSSYISKMLMQ